MSVIIATDRYDDNATSNGYCGYTINVLFLYACLNLFLENLKFCDYKRGNFLNKEQSSLLLILKPSVLKCTKEQIYENKSVQWICHLNVKCAMRSFDLARVHHWKIFPVAEYLRYVLEYPLFSSGEIVDRWNLVHWHSGPICVQPRTAFCAYHS